MDQPPRLEAEATSGVEGKRKKRHTKDKKRKRRRGTRKAPKAADVPGSVFSVAPTPGAKHTEHGVYQAIPAQESTAVGPDDLQSLPSTTSKLYPSEKQSSRRRSVHFAGVPSHESPVCDASTFTHGSHLTISITCASPDDLLQELSDFSEPVAVAEPVPLEEKASGRTAEDIQPEGKTAGRRLRAPSFISLRRLLLPAFTPNKLPLPQTRYKRSSPGGSRRSSAALPAAAARTDVRRKASDTAMASAVQPTQASTLADMKPRRLSHAADRHSPGKSALGKPDLETEAESIYPMIFSGGLSSASPTVHTEYVTSVILKEALFITESSLHGLVLTVLHCLSGAIASILTKRLKIVPKSKIAFYIALMSLCAGMPGAMSMTKPFGPLELQPLLLLRSCLVIASIMLKAMALVYIHVSEVVVISALIPIGVSLGSRVFLNEKINKLQWLSMGMTVLGVAIVMRPLGRQSFNVEHITGILFSLGAVLAVIQLYVVVRYVRHLTVRKYGFNGSCCTMALSMAVSLFTGTFGKLLSGRLLATLMMMGQVNWCAIVFLNKALEMESAAVVTTFKFCGDIILSMVLEAIFLDTYPDTWGCIGSAVIVLSVLVMGFEKLTHLYGCQMSPLMQWLCSPPWFRLDWLWQRTAHRDEYCTNL